MPRSVHPFAAGAGREARSRAARPAARAPGRGCESGCACPEPRSDHWTEPRRYAPLLVLVDRTRGLDVEARPHATPSRWRAGPRPTSGSCAARSPRGWRRGARSAADRPWWRHASCSAASVVRGKAGGAGATAPRRRRRLRHSRSVCPSGTSHSSRRKASSRTVCVVGAEIPPTALFAPNYGVPAKLPPMRVAVVGHVEWIFESRSVCLFPVRSFTPITPSRRRLGVGRSPGCSWPSSRARPPSTPLLGVTRWATLRARAHRPRPARERAVYRHEASGAASCSSTYKASEPSPCWACPAWPAATRFPGKSSTRPRRSTSPRATSRPPAAPGGAGVPVSTARGLETLSEARVELDALVSSGNDPGERYAGDLVPPPRYVVRTAGGDGGEWESSAGESGRWGGRAAAGSRQGLLRLRRQPSPPASRTVWGAAGRSRRHFSWRPAAERHASRVAGPTRSSLAGASVIGHVPVLGHDRQSARHPGEQPAVEVVGPRRPRRKALVAKAERAPERQNTTGRSRSRVCARAGGSPAR